MNLTATREMVQQNIIHLVRPRTVMQDTNRAPPKAKPPPRSFVILSLCGACMFLLILSICLITSLVLVGRNLSASATTVTSSAAASLSLERSKGKVTKHFLGKQKPAYDDQDNNSIMALAENGTKLIVSKVLDQLSWRLPTTIRPSRYSLFMDPDFQTKRFTGRVAIELKVSKPTTFIAVHANKLSITGTTLERQKPNNTTKEQIRIANTFDFAKFQYWVTETDESLSIGDYLLTLNFSGSLTDNIVGFYQSSYIAADRKTVRYMATSKFEPTYARQAFPCFDEPAMKARFKISLVRPRGDGYIALSNTDQESFEDNVETDKTIVHFEESVPMSTYLACFIVSDFRFKELPILAGGVGTDFRIRAFATPAQLDKVDFALDTGKKITEFYIQYFQEPYPLSKLDMAAIPDFVSGAMEHWGLLTYRETSLLYDATISSSANKRRVAEVVAHELAHMWFGNLVTMAWWDELWLNEGFASYIEYKGVNAALPEWKITDMFITSDLHGVLDLDATLGSHPIVQTAENPDQITELFDTITYSKGASIIRMLEDFVGSDVFSKSVSNYLKKHKYGNAVTEDLLQEVELALENTLDVKYIMSTWTKQMGYPVVNVERVSPTEFRLTQKRFFANPKNEQEAPKDSEFNYRWYIPITYKTDVSDSKRIWFRNEDTAITLSDVGAHKWLKLNQDQVGYYRVNYPADMWQALTDALIENALQFSVSDRGHLINDVFSLAEATQIPYSTALELTSYLKNEKDYVPWYVASSKLNRLKNLLYYTESYSKFSAFSKSIILAPYESQSWIVGDNLLENLQRTTILSLACSMGVQQCIDRAGEEFIKWLDNPVVRPTPDLRELIYYYGMYSVGNEERWFKVWDLYLQETDAQERSKLMYALSAVQVPWILQRYVELAELDVNVRSQDYFTVMQYIAANRVGEIIVWDYVRQNWPQLVDRFGLNERYLGRMIPSITSRFTTSIRLQEIRDFFAKYPEAGAGAAARLQALEQVQNNIEWLQNNSKDIADWLAQNV